MASVADDRQFAYAPRDFERVRQLIHAKAGIAQIASNREENLWRFALPDGRGMRQGMAFIFPFA